MISDIQYWNTVLSRYFAGCNDKDILHKKPKRKRFLTIKNRKMEFKNNPISDKVGGIMNDLKKKGVDLTLKIEHGYDGSKYNRVYEAFYKLVEQNEKLQAAGRAILDLTMYFEVGSEGEHFEDLDEYNHLREMLNLKIDNPLRISGAYICVANNKNGVYASDICGYADTAIDSARNTCEELGGTCEVFAKYLETGMMESIMKYPLPDEVLEEAE